VVVCAIVSITEDVLESPTAVVRWGLCEEENVGRMVVEYGDNIR
jgi:hypothetical protein